MIRYRTRDLRRLLPGTARTMRRMERIAGRSDDMLIIRGVNVFPSQIEEQLLATESLAPHYFIEIGKQGHLDALTVNVELAGSAAESQKEIAAQSLRQRIKSYIGVSAEVRVHHAGGIPRSEGKAKRIIDAR